MTYGYMQFQIKHGMTRKLFFSHCDYLLCKHKCIAYARLEFSEDRRGLLR